MFKTVFTIIASEVKMTLRQAFSWSTPLLFFLTVIALFPLALGSHTELLETIAPGVIWVSTLLAILISIGQLFRDDYREGHLDFLFLSAESLTLIVLAKITSHWLMHCFPFILLTPIVGLLYGLSWHVQAVLAVTLLLGTPVFCLLGAIGAALTIGIRQHGLLLPVLIMPLYIPTLIFGTGALMAASLGQMLTVYYAMMGAILLLTLGFAPVMTAFALRIGVNQ